MKINIFLLYYYNVRGCRLDMDITVIIPIYNVERYLEQCLKSVVDQSIPFDEVILVNDGSKDGSLLICEKYASKYTYFRLINQSNKGLSSARNIGVKKARCKYVMFLDSDDFLKPNTVLRLKSELRKLQIDAIFFDADIICEEGCKINKNIYDRSKTELDGRYMSGLDFFVECYPKNYVVSACLAVFKKSILFENNIFFPEGVYFEDNYFSFVFLNNANSIMYISEKLYLRRYRKNSITTSDFSEKKLVDYIIVGLLIWDKVMSLDLLKMKEIFFEYIDDYFGIVLQNYQLCLKKDIDLGKRTGLFLEQIVKKYIIILELHLNYIEDFSLFTKVLSNLNYIQIWNLGDGGYIEKIIRCVVEKQKKFYTKLLYELPLQEKVSVGIYGTGKHTKGLLELYRRLIGRIKCDLIFLDSYINDDGLYELNKIINYQKVDEKIQLVIISSFIYEKEMIQNIKSINNRIPLYRFYDNLKRDVFSEYEIFLKYC